MDIRYLRYMQRRERETVGMKTARLSIWIGMIIVLIFLGALFAMRGAWGGSMIVWALAVAIASPIFGRGWGIPQ